MFAFCLIAVMHITVILCFSVKACRSRNLAFRFLLELKCLCQLPINYMPSIVDSLALFSDSSGINARTGQ